MLDGGLRKFMIDAVGWLDDAEDELLILEEDFQSQYSNSGGPAENEPRLANVKEAVARIRAGADAEELAEMARLLDAILSMVSSVMREGHLELSPERLTALLGGIDGVREQFDSLESGGVCGPAEDSLFNVLMP